MDSRPTRWQFGLGSLLVAVLACAVVFGLIVNASTEYQVTVRYRQLPANDQKLKDWLVSQDGVHDVLVRRDGNSVRASFSRRGLRWSFGLLDPPWEELGYSDIEGLFWSVENRGLLGGFSNWLSQLPVGAWVVLCMLVGGLVAAAKARR